VIRVDLNLLEALSFLMSEAKNMPCALCEPFYT
jgi:hypothetical protein